MPPRGPRRQHGAEETLRPNPDQPYRTEVAPPAGLRLRLREPAVAGRLIALDVGNAAASPVVSVALALVLPRLAHLAGLASVSTAYAAP